MAINPTDESGTPMALRDLRTPTPLDDQLSALLRPLGFALERTRYEGLLFTASGLLLPPKAQQGPWTTQTLFAREIYRASGDRRVSVNPVLAATAKRDQCGIVWHFDWLISTDHKDDVTLLEETLVNAVALDSRYFWATFGMLRTQHSMWFVAPTERTEVAVSAYLVDIS